MKTKLLPAVICTFSIFNSFAQNNFQKGSVLLGGTINFISNKFDSDPQQSHSYSSFSIYPSAGIAVRENVFIGTSIGFGYNKNRNYYNTASIQDSTKTFTYSYGVFVRKYKPLKHNFSILLQGDLGGSNSNEKLEQKNTASDYSSKTFGISASLSPGISYAINSKLQLEAGLNNIVGIGYSENKTHNSVLIPEFTKSTNFNVYTSLSNFTSQLYFGFRLLLQKKDKMVASK